MLNTHSSSTRRPTGRKAGKGTSGLRQNQLCILLSSSRRVGHAVTPQYPAHLAVLLKETPEDFPTPLAVLVVSRGLYSIIKLYRLGTQEVRNLNLAIIRKKGKLVLLLHHAEDLESRLPYQITHCNFPRPVLLESCTSSSKSPSVLRRPPCTAMISQHAAGALPSGPSASMPGTKQDKWSIRMRLIK